MSKFDFNETFKQEWDNLQFYYEIDEQKNLWLFSGSLSGYMNFCEILSIFSMHEEKNIISSHEHLGPYSYLKLIVWEEPLINHQGIYGKSSDFQRLAKIITRILKDSKVESEFTIDKEYSKKNTYGLQFKVMPNNFKPSDADIDLH